MQMSEPFLSEIKIFGFNWPPKGWAQCDGQILPINQNEALFSLVGTKYGGDGQTSFALPDMRGRTPMHANGGKYSFGQKGGEEKVTLDITQIPEHSHELNGTTENADTKVFTNTIIAAGYDLRPSKLNPLDMYAPADNLTSLNPSSVVAKGSSASHDNKQPSCVVNFCIAVQGQFPSRD